MKESEHIKILNGINEKLYPIVDIIQDSYPELYDRVDNIVDSPIFEGDGDESNDEN